MAAPSKVKNELGNKYGRLTVTSYAGTQIDKSGNKNAIWNCICECGSTKVVDGQLLRQNKVKSCGCLQRDSSHGFMSSYEAGLSRLYSRYKAQAKTRGVDFTLTKSEFAALVVAPCEYCGTEPSQVVPSMRAETEKYFIYNGVDRIDNSLGYSPENTVSCCGKCNRMKSSMSVSEFLEHSMRIVSLVSKKVMEVPYASTCD